MLALAGLDLANPKLVSVANSWGSMGEALWCRHGAWPDTLLGGPGPTNPGQVWPQASVCPVFAQSVLPRGVWPKDFFSGVLF